jgi:hypothetical protein
LQGDQNKEKLERVVRELNEIKPNDLKFSFYLPVLTTLSTICVRHVSSQADVISKTDTLSVGFDKPLFFLLSSGKFVPIQLKIEFTCTSKLIETPHTVLSYEQNDFGALAWVLESFYHSSRGPIWMKMPVARSENEFTISRMFVTIPEDMEFNFQLEKRGGHKTEYWKAVTKNTS